MGSVDLATWKKGLQADIDLLRAANIQPRALLIRLEEAMAGKDGYNDWYAFRACGRGESSQYVDIKSRTVMLVFRHRQYAREVMQRLNELKSQFTILAKLSYREYGNRDHASISFEFPEPAR